MKDDTAREHQEHWHRGRPWATLVARMSSGVGDLRAMMGRKALEQRLAALRAVGCPMSFAELEERTKLPEGAQNAAPVYERAFAALVPWTDEVSVPFFEGAKPAERGLPLPEPMAKDIADFLTRNRECLSLLHEAANIEECRYRRTITDLLPHPEGLRMCATLLKLNSLFQGQQGDSAGVVPSVRDGLRLADSLRRGPVALTHLVRLNLFSAALTGLEWALSATDFTDRQLRALDDALGASARTLDLAEALAGERSYALETYNDPPERHGPLYHSPLLRLACVRRLGLIDCLDYTAGALEACKLPSVPRLARFREMEKAADNSSFVHVMIKADVFWTTPLVVADLRLQARLLLARTALAMERYRLVTGELPDQVADLVPLYLESVPVDPFDDQPIRYRLLEGSYLLYSVDADGQDNGGRERDRNDDNVPCDLPFIVTR